MDQSGQIRIRQRHGRRGTSGNDRFESHAIIRAKRIGREQQEAGTSCEIMPAKRCIAFSHSHSAYAIFSHPRAGAVGHGNRTIGILIVLNHCDQAAADGDCGAIERMHEVRALLAFVSVANAQST